MQGKNNLLNRLNTMFKAIRRAFMLKVIFDDHGNEKIGWLHSSAATSDGLFMLVEYDHENGHVDFTFVKQTHIMTYDKWILSSDNFLERDKDWF